MLKASKAHTRLITAVALMALPALVSAQGYYDDDIYYNPSKKKKDTTVTTKSQGQNANRQGIQDASLTSQYEYVDYPSSDVTSYTSVSTRDIDEYNRHGQFLVSDTVSADTVETDVYANTRRIQRFHNNDVIDLLNDDDYATYVLTDPTQVNIYVNNPYYPSYYSPYYTLYPYSWGWNGYYSPWLNYTWGIYSPWYWGPSWSWTWGPSWAWGPSWGYGPGWGPGPGWGHGPGWGPGGRPQQAWRPTPSGSSRPHAYAGAGSSSARPSTVRPVSTTSAGRLSNTARPGSSSIGNRYPASTDRVNVPGNSSSNTGTPIVGGSATRGRNNGSGTTTNRVSTPAKNSGSSNVSTGRGSSGSGNVSTGRGSSNTSRGSSSSSTRGSSSSSSSSSSYNRSGSSTSRSSGGYSGGGGSRGGGGSHSSGGGGGRGRR